MASTESGLPATVVSTTDDTFARGVGISVLPPKETHLTAPKPTIAIVSIGEMGAGIAKLLSTFQYPVVTNLDGRSAKTRAIAESIGLKVQPLSDIISAASVFLSIVPPAEALAVAQNVTAQFQLLPSHERRPTYIDLNAISPHLARQISQIVENSGMTFIDGAIIGFPPRELDDKSWFRPAITLSGPRLSELESSWTQQLISLLNIRHVGCDVGAASGLKMCFGAIYKGHAAIATQAYATAQNLGVLPALRTHLEEYFPTSRPIIESSIMGSQRKAYRWIKEMEEIEDTFAKEGGWSRDLFHGVADVFRMVAFDTDLQKDSKSDVESITREICVSLKRRKSL